MSQTESSSHQLRDKLDDTLDDISQTSQSEEIVASKKGRKTTNRIYEPFMHLETLETALEMLKDAFHGTKVTRLNSHNGVIWYKCKQCEKRLNIRLAKDGSDKCSLFLEMDFLDENQVHSHDIETEPETTNGISADVKKLIIEYDNLSKLILLFTYY